MMRVEPLTPLLVPAWRRLFEQSSCDCYCRYWHFEGTKNEWLDRCSHRPEENAAEEFQHLGDALANLGDFANAISFFDLAIGRDASYEVAFIHRGIAKRHKGTLDQAIADLSQALHLNSVTIEKLTIEYDRRQRNVWGDMKDESTKGELANRRARALQERGKACDEATMDAKGFLAMTPDQVMGFYILGRCDAQAGRTESARTNFQRAMELAVDPMEKGVMKNLLDGLEP